MDDKTRILKNQKQLAQFEGRNMRVLYCDAMNALSRVRSLLTVGDTAGALAKIEDWMHKDEALYHYYNTTIQEIKRDQRKANKRSRLKAANHARR